MPEDQDSGRMPGQTAEGRAHRVLFVPVDGQIFRADWQAVQKLLLVP